MKSVDAYNSGAAPIYIRFHNNTGTLTAGAGVVFTVGVQPAPDATW